MIRDGHGLRGHQRPVSVTPREEDDLGLHISTRFLMRCGWDVASPMMRRVRMQRRIGGDLTRIQQLTELGAPAIIIDGSRRQLWSHVEHFNAASRILHLPQLASKLKVVA